MVSRRVSSSIAELEHLLTQGRDVEIKPDGTVVVQDEGEQPKQDIPLTKGKDLGSTY